MKTALLTGFLLFLGFGLFAQDGEEKVPRFHKVKIGTSDTYAYFPNDEEFTCEVSYSPDSSKVYTGEVLCGNYHFAIIVVKLNGTELVNQEEREDMLMNYMNYLQEAFSIIGAAGYGKGHTMEKYPEATGIIDYWEDEDGDQWAVKGWADTNTLAVLMLYGTGTYPHYTAQELFLDGFRFDGE